MQLYNEFMPTVSVILPTFNRSGLIKRAINSVISQKCKDWELLIIDDGSSDETFEICRSYQGKYENIKYCRHSNRKLPVSLNTGIQLSIAEYITFLGSDDEYLPEHLAQRLQFMKENPEIDLVHGGVKIIGDPFVKDKTNLTRKIHLSECTIGGTFFGKSSMFKSLEGFRNINYSEDSDFLERARSFYRISKVEYPTYIYHRDTPDSITNNIE